MTHIVIIGAGIAGLAAASRLSADAKVTVLERETHVGYHASGRSAAMFEENYGNDTVRALNRASRPVHEALGVLAPRGLLGVARAGDGAAFEADIRGLGLIEVPVAEARARVPILADDIRRAGIHEGAFDIDTDLLMQKFLAEARAQGAELRLGTELTGLQHNDGWELSLTGETLRADILVNAAGAWADRIARLAEAKPLGMQPYRRSMARLPAPGGHDVSGWPMLMGPGESWYAKPDAGAWIVSPGEEDPVEPMDAWADDMVLAEGLARYQPYVTEEVTRVETNWAGLRTFAPDRSLVIGEDPDVDGFFWMAGQGGYGFQTAPAAGALLADLVNGRKSPLGANLVTALSPGRF